ncbi:HET-domain-containing protein [Clathrospora elynae]|uniref:HET-domain-containing protein n=1 Tax=Clathrospora elynae TaxID=706981 RepID=A0A6A5SCK0_9PLEO|nr:HET-domain-containing protein [Clathrospora elynae]
MLNYRGTRQPPRKYRIPETQAIASPREDPCDICLTRTWTPKLFSTLAEASIEDKSVSSIYGVMSHELRKSVLEGCQFCRTLADGIHGRVFLDELYARYEITDSLPASIASENDTLSGAGDTYPGEESAGEEDVHEWNDASTFNEEEIDDDVTGGWEAWKDRDTLAETCSFKISLSFERGKAGFFTFVNARVEAAGNVADQPNELQMLYGDKAVELHYHVSVNGDNTSDIAGLFPITTMNSTLGADVNMQMIETWVQNFDSMKDTMTLNAIQAPARLIDLQHGGALRIVDSSTIRDYRRGFAALSYVWGTNQTFVLLSKTELSLRTDFQVAQLPQTIQDAVTVTRRIGLRYLWVDALCIMQDSNDDKARELPKMRLIYKSAAVTIVASVAKSATEGFLHHVEEKYDYFIDPVTIPFPTQETSVLQTNVVLSFPADYKRWKDPINSRAWTFQELLLSTRAILFSYRGVQTIDRTNPKEADGLTSGKEPQLPNLPWSGKMFSLATDPENTRQVWLAVRGEYSRRGLSYQGDKLLAIAAVAEELGCMYGSQYLAGMWERHLAMDLQWNYPRNEKTSDSNAVRKPRARGYVAPSWSWASVDGAVEDFVHVGEEEGDAGGMGTKEFLGFDVVSCDVKLAVPGFAYGAVTSGILVVKGRLCSFTWRPHGSDDLHNNLESDGFLARAVEYEMSEYPEIECGEATIDALEPDLQGGVEVTCLATRLIENVPGRNDVEGLMLIPAKEKQYRRVGFFKVYGPAMFEGVELETITII